MDRWIFWAILPRKPFLHNGVAPLVIQIGPGDGITGMAFPGDGFCPIASFTLHGFREDILLVKEHVISGTDSLFLLLNLTLVQIGDIYIINVRFSGEIHFIKEIEEGVTDVPMPAMILQPLVENSINHGLRDVEWEKKIWLSVYREEDRICVSVRDNGVGISPEQTQSILNNGLNGDGLQEHTTGVGLRNVIGRLRLFYNRDDVMEITSTGSGMGTEVAVFIPV